MSNNEGESSKLEFIHKSTSAHEIASVADFEVVETVENSIAHYQENGFSYIPLPYSEQYYNIENEELLDMDPGQVISGDTDLMSVIGRLIKHDFLFFDSYGKRIINQPEGDSLPYRHREGKIEFDGEFWGPRQIYDGYNELKERLPEEEHGLLLGLALERHRYFIISMPDINRRPVRTLCYQLLMQLETRLSEMIKGKYQSNELFKEVNHRTLGLWKQDEIHDNKVHIAEHMNLGEIKKVIRKSDDIVEQLGFESKTKFGEQLSGVVELRNKVMHPTRTLVHDVDGLEDQKDRLDRINELVDTLLEHQEESTDHPYSDDIDLPDDV